MEAGEVDTTGSTERDWRYPWLTIRGSFTGTVIYPWNVKREADRLANLIANRGPLQCRTDYGVGDE